MTDMQNSTTPKASGNHADKRDPMSVPLHMQGDEQTRNANIDAGKPLCERCDGTGNELFSMYRKCPECSGTGVAVTGLVGDTPLATTDTANSPNAPQGDPHA